MRRTKQAKDEVMFVDSSRTHAENARDVPRVTKMNVLLILGAAIYILQGLFQGHVPAILYSPHFYMGMFLFSVVVFPENNRGKRTWSKKFSPHIKIAAVGLIVLALMKEVPGETGYALLYFFGMEVSTGGRALVFSLLSLTAVLPLLLFDGYGLLPFPEILVAACVLALAIRIFEERNASKTFMDTCTKICLAFVFLAILYFIAIYKAISKQGILTLPREWVMPLFSLLWGKRAMIEEARELRQARIDAWISANGVFRWARNWSERLISILSFP
jgi:hypothetical protein